MVPKENMSQTGKKTEAQSGTGKLELIKRLLGEFPGVIPMHKQLHHDEVTEGAILNKFSKQHSLHSIIMFLSSFFQLNQNKTLISQVNWSFYLQN